MGDMGIAAANLRALALRARAAGPAAANAMASTYLTGVATGELRQTTHRKGTPTPSAPGQPPSLVTGSLRRSLRQQPAVQSGTYSWTALVYPTIVYARIQEYGGVTGRGHATRLPARPYLRPARIRLGPALHTIAVTTVSRVVR